MVESEEVTGALNRGQQLQQPLQGPAVEGAANSRFTGGKLYAEYLRREGKPGLEEGSQYGGSVRSRAGKDSVREEHREREEVDDQFRDF